MEKRLLITLRKMAWERAKGELTSMLQTYWSGPDYDDKRYQKLEEVLTDFFDEVESEALTD
jgi:hypothetical protein